MTEDEKKVGSDFFMPMGMELGELGELQIPNLADSDFNIGSFNEKSGDVLSIEPGEEAQEDKAEVLEVKSEDIQGQSDIAIEIEMPKLENYSEVIKPFNIEGALKKDKIETVVIEESNEIITPSYLIDFSNIDEILPCVLKGLDSIIEDSGDTAVYTKSNTGSILLVGFGMKSILYKVLEPYLNEVFDGAVNVYLNLGDGFKRIKKLAVDSVVLTL